MYRHFSSLTYSLAIRSERLRLFSSPSSHSGQKTFIIAGTGNARRNKKQKTQSIQAERTEGIKDGASKQQDVHSELLSVAQI